MRMGRGCFETQGVLVFLCVENIKGRVMLASIHVNCTPRTGRPTQTERDFEARETYESREKIAALVLEYGANSASL